MPTELNMSIFFSICSYLGLRLLPQALLIALAGSVFSTVPRV